MDIYVVCFFFQAEDGIRDGRVTGVQTCALPISADGRSSDGRYDMTALQDQLDEITANTRHLVQAERLAVGERAVEELFASGIEERILPVGAEAPGFALCDSNGKVVRSEDMLEIGR